MKIYDLSPEISESMAVYKDREEKRPKLRTTRTLKEGANESRMEIDLHTGSHIDAPFHVFKNGKTIEEMDMENFFGNAVVLDFTQVKGPITQKNFQKIKSKIRKSDIVLLKTKNKQEKKFDFNFTYLERTGARFLTSKNVKAVGIDSLGIERSQKNHETHKILLRKNILIFEGMDLSKVNAGRYLFYGFPLKIRKGDGSPVRAVLIK